MARRVAEEEDWDDDEEAEPLDDSDGDNTIPCPYCRRSIHEDSPRCPNCERYLSAEDAPPSPKPVWIIIGTLLCLFVVYRWIFG